MLTLVAALGSGSVAAAEESLVQSASRVVKDVVQAQATPVAGAVTAARPIPTQATMWSSGAAAPSSAVAATQEPTVLSKSGMSKSRKAMIYLAVGVGFAASIYAIDHHVVDVTPSSLGTRKD